MLRFGKYLITFVVLNNFLVCVPCVRYQTRPRCPEGDCVLITTCPSAAKDITTGNYPKVCGWADKIPYICCQLPDTPATEEPTDLEEKSGNFRGINPEGCGVRILPEEDYNVDPRTELPLNTALPFGPPGFTIPPIQFAIGGRSATHKWPWMVAIYNGNKKKQLCGGALIDERHILTAAHCFAGRSLNPKLYSVQVGELQIGETIPYYEVEEVKTHEDYRPRYDYDDIAIMRLAQPLPSDIVPACLPTLDGIIAGDNVTILGWGDLSFGGPSSSILQEVQDIPVVGNSECDAKFRKIAKARFPRGIWNKFVCAGLEKGGKDACQGDSGGPLLHQDSKGIWSLVGIVSFGYKCGEPGFPGVYTKVSAYMPWIANNMRSENEVSMEMRKARDFDYIDGKPIWTSKEESVLFPG